MTYSIRMAPQSPSAKTNLSPATLQKLFGSLVHVGGLGRYFEYEPTPTPAGDTLEAACLLYGVNGLFGRGFYLYIEKDYAAYEIGTTLPTTVHDLEDFFTFAGMLAGQLGAKDVKDSFGSYPRAMLPTLYPDVLKQNLNVMQKMAATQPGFVVSGVRFPLVVPPAVCARIASVPPINGERFFAAYLHEKQRQGANYLKPTFAQAEDGAVLGHYEINEGVAYVAPIHPFVPFGPPPFGGAAIAAWQVGLVSSQWGALGNLPYETFVERLAKHEQRPLDEQYFILSALSHERLQALTEGG